MSGRGRFWHWPGWGQLAYALGLGLAATLWFAAIYGGAAWFTGRHDYRVPLALPVDLAMPFVPGMAILYLSLNVLLWCAPFVLRTRRELRAMTAALAVATAVAGACFVILPGYDVFPAPSAQELGHWANLYHFARWLALPHNYLPSLHVAFTTISIAIYSYWASVSGKLLLGVLGLAIISSTLLTHQHYIADVATGFLLGWAAVRCVYRPLAARPAAVRSL